MILEFFVFLVFGLPFSVVVFYTFIEFFWICCKILELFYIVKVLGIHER